VIERERKERLLKHIKETAEFLNVQPIPLKSFQYYDFNRFIECCPIIVFFGSDFADIHFGGTIEDFNGECKKIYEYTDSIWWKELSPDTRKSVIKWLNERIEKGFL